MTSRGPAPKRVTAFTRSVSDFLTLKGHASQPPAISSGLYSTGISMAVLVLTTTIRSLRSATALIRRVSIGRGRLSGSPSRFGGLQNDGYRSVSLVRVNYSADCRSLPANCYHSDVESGTRRPFSAATILV